MSLTIDQAYSQIKALEQSGNLSLPKPQDTVEVGTINAVSGEFTYAVETLTQTYTHPPLNVDPPSLPPGFPPPQPAFAVHDPAEGGFPTLPTHPIGPGGPGGTGFPQPPINIIVGIVRTSAVDLRLKFNVSGAVRTQPVHLPLAHAAHAGGAGAAGGIATNGGVFTTGPGVAVGGFPTITSDSAEIVLDAGFACSAKLQTQNVAPPIEIFPLTITAAGQSQFIHIRIFRPPVLGFGAFTIPALPITLIYAPPQRKQAKNSASYRDTFTLSRTLSSSLTFNHETKNVQAYTVADIVDKAAAAIATVATLAAGAAAAAAPAPAGLSSDGGSDSTDLQGASAELNLVSSILNGVGGTSSNTTSTALTVESDQSLKLSYSNSDMFGSAAGLGPGVGDRLIYMSNVRVVWMALNGVVGIHVLGFESVNALAAQALIQDQQALANGGVANNTGLDAASLKNLLSLDPFTVHRRLDAQVGPPLISPPRFVPANPAERKGEGTSGDGDQFSTTYEITNEDKQVTTAVQTSIPDVKPGWLAVIFGAPNMETTTTMTVTVSQSSDVQTDEAITNTATFFSQGPDDPYDVFVFYDRLFGTFAFPQKGSPVLDGVVSPTVFT